MLSSNAKQWMLGAASAAILMSFSLTVHAKTNINLAVASNFYSVPPLNSAITDLINAFTIANPKYTVTVVDNGATAALENHIINSNSLKVDLFFGSRHRYPPRFTYQSL